jgi:hypothetical protein
MARASASSSGRITGSAERAGWLAVAAGSKPVARMFRATDLTRCLLVHATVADAIIAAQAGWPGDA